MNVLIVSQCSGNTLKETRRILDQFAERRGDRTWQTSITKDGLDTLQRLLRKTARKNTAVACHWIRGIDHSELVWIVGDSRQFNSRGAVPTNVTKRDMLRYRDENNWHTLQDIYLLSAFAGLLHDLGKSCNAFQDSLKSKGMSRNVYRHEWISLRFFQAFVGDSRNDTEWLKRMAYPTEENDSRWTITLQRDGLDAESPTPFQYMPPLAQAIGWLIVSHHRMPNLPPRKGADGFNTSVLAQIPGCITAEWNQPFQDLMVPKDKTYWQFRHGAPMHTQAWKSRAARLALKLLNRDHPESELGWLDNPFVMHLARLSLMLADHTYSSLPSNPRYGTTEYPLFANTDRATGELKQRLDEHLLGVESICGQVAHALPVLTTGLSGIVGHRRLRQRNSDERYRWQDKAAELAERVRDRAAMQGAFVVNMASTGSGKTLANARIMYALADPERGMRCAFALGLRTLTYQTGKEYRERLTLNEDEVAIRIGNKAGIELAEHFIEMASATGSESTQSLLDEEENLFFDGSPEVPPIVERILKDPNTRALVLAPMLICTVDQLIPATESTRGGHQIAPMMRLISGDLVLDELDDYDIDDLSAIARLMHWAGMLGCRVLISSATLPPALVKGMFDAYREGRRQFQLNRGERLGEMPDVCCIWIDEFGCTVDDSKDVESFEEAHKKFVDKRRAKLNGSPARRKGHLIELKSSNDDPHDPRKTFAHKTLLAAIELHNLHSSTDPRSGKQVSFGLVRMANIGPLFDVALAMLSDPDLIPPDNFRIHLCVYHSQHPLLVRSTIENRLDDALDRHTPNGVFELPDIRKRLDNFDDRNHLFIVLGSPITEVGRDHDYDWAIVEPSSMRSIIQIAGRVNRHRDKTITDPNLLIFDRNLRSIEVPGQPAYWRPGFENGDFRLTTHDLNKLLADEDLTTIDARPRIVARQEKELRPRERLVDLEHARLERAMCRPLPRQLTARELRAGVSNSSLGAYTWWVQQRSTLSAILQTEQRFRKQTQKQLDLVLLPSDNGDEAYLAYRLDPQSNKSGKASFRTEYVKVDDSLNQRIDLRTEGRRFVPWSENNYMSGLSDLAAELEIDLSTCAKRFGVLSLPDSTNGWRYHPVLGFDMSRD